VLWTKIGDIFDTQSPLSALRALALWTLLERDSLLIMVALCNRADHYIFALLFLSFYLSFFPRLISAAVGCMSTIL